jgi:hypothetical protein
MCMVLSSPAKAGDDSRVLLFYFFGPGTAGNGELSACR